MPVVDIKGVGKAQFPDDMNINDIRAFLRNKYAQQAMSGQSDALAKQPVTAEPTTPTLAEKAGQGVSDFLFDKGIISDRHGAQQVGSNLTTLGGFLPGVGDAVAGDEFGRAAAKGDNFGMAMAGLGIVPVAGDALKQTLRKAKSVNLPSGKLGSDQFKIIKQSDPKAKTKSNPDGSVTVEYLEEYQPKQLSGDLYEFEPDALEISEDSFKNTVTYKGDKNKPISVTKENGDYKILDGHHRAKLAKEKGEKVSAIVIPVGDVAKMQKQGLNQADMLDEWSKKNQSLPMDQTKGLYKTHNLTREAIEKASDFGGLPVPSIAIANKDSGFDSFGDISLIGDKNSFSKDPTFASDVYSPRFPRAKDKIDYQAARTEEARLSGIVDPKIDGGFSSQFNPERLSEDLSRLEESTGNKAAFLKGIGETIDPSKYTSAPSKPELKMGDHGFAIKGKRLMPREALTNKRHINATDSWLKELEGNGVDVGFWRNEDGTPNEDALKTTYKGMRQDRQAIEDYEKGPVFDRFKAKDDIDEKVKQNQEKFNSYIADQKNRISKGKVFTKFNPKNATTKEFDYNLSNAVKLMKGNIRGGEGFSYGVGSIRAQVAPKLTSIKQITDRRGQIVGEDQMTMVKEGFNSRLDNLYDDLSGNWAWDSTPSYSEFADGIENAAKGDLGDFKNLNKQQKSELQGFFDELANAPTNYFEVKPQRAVDINEFYGAAVPEGTSKQVIDILKGKGLKIETYKPEKRMDAIKKLNVKSGGNIFFSGAGAAMLYGAANKQEENKS